MPTTTAQEIRYSGLEIEDLFGSIHGPNDDDEHLPLWLGDPSLAGEVILVEDGSRRGRWGITVCFTQHDGRNCCQKRLVKRTQNDW